MRHSLQQRNVQDLSAKQVTAWSRNGSVKTKKRETPTKTRNKTYPTQFCTISNRTTTKRSRTRRRATLSTKTHRCQFRWALATRWTASHRASATPTPKSWHFAELFADTTAKVQIGKKSEHDDVYEDEQLSLCGDNQLPRPRHVWQVKPYLLLFPKIVPAVWMVWFPRKAELSRPTRLSGLVFAPERLTCLDSFRVRQVSMHYLLRSTIERGAELYNPSEEAYEMLKAAWVGGPSLVFKRYHEAGVTKIRPHRLSKPKKAR